MRWGALTDDDIAVLNQRVFDPEQLNISRTNQPPTDPAFWYRPFVIATNRIRCAINNSMTLEIGRRQQRIVYQFDAEPANRRTRLGCLYNLDDYVTDRVPLRWQFTIGMPVAVSRKCPPLHKAEVIANGTIGFVVGFDRCARDPQHTVHVIDGVTIHRLCRIPDMIYIHVQKCNRILVEGFPPGTIGIPASVYSVKMSLPDPNDKAKTWSINVNSFNLITTYALTPEKI